MRAANSWLGPDGQCASIAGSRGVFCEKGLHGPVAADPQGDSYVQQLACQEDRPFSRYLLNRVESRCGAVALVSAKTSTTCTSIASGLFVDRSRTSSQAAGIPRT